MTLNEQLGEAALRKLTEFLGVVPSCSNCGAIDCDCADLDPPMGKMHIQTPDFSDPRVWTRLVEKIKGISIAELPTGNFDCTIYDFDIGIAIASATGATRAEAVCCACLSMIEEGEKP